MIRRTSNKTLSEKLFQEKIILLTGPRFVRIVDLIGGETANKANTLLLYIYSDGCVEKVFRSE